VPERLDRILIQLGRPCGDARRSGPIARRRTDSSQRRAHPISTSRMRPLFIVVGLALVAVIVLWLVVPPRALRRHASKFDPD
jgi:hypothetical protein